MTYKITEHDVQNDDIIERQANADEIADIEARLAKRTAIDLQEKNKATLKAQVLEKLGLTAEEAAVLLG